MNNQRNNDFEPTSKKSISQTPSSPTQQELDSIEYVLPINKKKKKKHICRKSNVIPDASKEAESIEYVYAKPQNKRKKKKKKAAKILITVLCIILALVILTAGTIFIFNEVGKSAMHNYDDVAIEPTPEVENVEEISDGGKTIKYNGNTYALNEKIATVVFMGIDDEKSDTPTDVIGTAGQADAIYIAVIDTSNKKVSILGVSRDTMVDVNVYNTDGEFTKTDNMQICLSYAYGDGKETSCENTIVSLERLFYGMPFNTYFTIETKALEELTTTIGGVELTTQCEFFSHNNHCMIPAGQTISLYGKDATQYIRTRDMDELDSNNDRMTRQKQFITAFIAQIWDSVKSNPASVLDLYSTIDDYSTTNLTPAKMTYLATTALTQLDSYNEIEYINVPGTIKKGEYAELIVDQNGLMELMLDLFYIQVS